MQKSLFSWIGLCILSISVCLTHSACEPIQPSPTQETIQGTVFDENGPVDDAIVRVQTTDRFTTTDASGKFSLSVESLQEGPYKLTAWASGYFNAGPVEAESGQLEVQIQLHAHHQNDNPEYTWLPSQKHPGVGEDQGCAACHSAEGTGLDFSLPVDEWLQDAHSAAAINPRFVSMYNGTDLLGNHSPLTRFGFHKDYGSFPLRPNPELPYFGPGYKLDFPDTAGNCAACHTPAASVNDPYGVDPTVLSGVPAEGIPCDFCHKVWDVKLNPGNGLPFENTPGVLAFEFRRPPQDHQFFAGPLDDVAPGEDTYSPIQIQSQFCAPCHFGTFWGTVVYNSFGEWLDSAYSNPETGKTCQDCHMPTQGVAYFARPDQGGLERPPETIFSHRMPGASDVTLLQNAVALIVDAKLVNQKVEVEVSITNDQTGHHIPTDSPLRQMILLVQVYDNQGKPLTFLDGPTLPEWCGMGDTNQGYYAGEAGVAYAKILEEVWTEVSPTGAYWNPTRLQSDNRLAAFARDSSNYVFEAPAKGGVNVEVRLLFRRAFIEMMDQKGWDVPDIVMETDSLHLTP